MTSLLSTPLGRFATESDHLVQFFQESPQVRLIRCRIQDYDPRLDGCVVALWDAWNRFVRELLLTCAAGEVEDLSGTVHRPDQIRSEPEALEYLRLCKKAGAPYQMSPGKRNEPKWYMSQNVEYVTKALGLVNAQEISSALTASEVYTGASIALPNPTSSVQTVRNYIAHKSVANSEKLRNFDGLMPGATVVEYLRERTRGGSCRFADWVDALQGLAEAACS